MVYKSSSLAASSGDASVPSSVSQGGTGQSSLTSHAVILGEGVSPVGFATTGVSARILIDQGAGADPAFKVVSGDSILSASGAMTNTAVNAVAYPSSPSTNTVPVVTSSNQITYEAVPNAALANSSITINTGSGLSGGGAVALGGTLTISNTSSASVSSVFGRTGAVTAQWNDYNFNLVGGTATASQGGTGLATLTAHAVMLGEGVANVSFATTGTAGRLLIDQGAVDPKFQAITGAASINSAGVITLTNSAITIGAQTGLAGGGSVALGSAITLSMGTSVANTLAGYNSSGVFSDVSIGSNLTLSGGVLAASGGGAVSSVFGRTGAVVAVAGDYGFSLISGTAAVSQGGTGAVTFTAHSVLLGEGTSAISAATTGTAARILIDQGAVDPAFKAISGDASLSSTGAMVNTAVNGVTYPASPGTNTVPVVTSSNVVTYQTVPNAALANSAITIGARTGLAGGGSVALGSAITLSMGTGAVNTLTGYNSSGVFSGVSIGTNLNLVSGVIGTSNFSAGANIGITYSTNTLGIAYTGAAGGVSSVSNSDGSLTISPINGAVVASLNPAHANTWTATQTGAVSGGVSSFISQGCIEFAIFSNGNSGTSKTIKWDNGNIQSVTITGAVTLGFTNPTYPGRLTVISTMSATSGYAYAYPSTVLWPGGQIPTLSSVSNLVDISSFLFDGSKVYGIANTNFL